MAFIQDKLVYVQVIPNYWYSIVPKCTGKNACLLNGRAFLFDVMSQSELTAILIGRQISVKINNWPHRPPFCFSPLPDFRLAMAMGIEPLEYLSINYSGGSKTEHLKPNAIPLPNVLKVGFRMVQFSNGRSRWRPFCVRTCQNVWYSKVWPSHLTLKSGL